MTWCSWTRTCLQTNMRSKDGAFVMERGGAAFTDLYMADKRRYDIQCPHRTRPLRKLEFFRNDQRSLGTPTRRIV